MNKLTKGLIGDRQFFWRLFWIGDDTFAISDCLCDQSAVIVAVDRQLELFASRGCEYIEVLHDAKCLLLSIQLDIEIPGLNILHFVDRPLGRLAETSQGI